MGRQTFYCIAFFCAAQVWAVPPAPGVAPRASVCRVNPRAITQRVEASRRAPGLLAPPAQASPRVLVLRVQFSNLAFTTTPDPAVLLQSVRDFYTENSYGVFHPTFTVSAIFTLPLTEGSYGQNCGDDVACNTPDLLADAAIAANPSVNFADFDQLMVYHAGFGEESNGVASAIWSVFMPGAFSVDAKSFDGFTVVPERELGASALGVISHEYGHQLGLPDLYDISGAGGSSTVGAWDLMDYPWAGSPPGANPPHLGAWSKKFLGFGAVVVTTTAFTMDPVETSGNDIYRIFASGQEYFLAEYRLRSAGTYDGGLPQAAGVAVWHVDDAVALNPFILGNNTVNTPSQNGRGHRGVDLVEADGVPVGAFDLGASDGWVDGQTLASPQTDLFTGTPSGMVLSNILGVGGLQASASLSQILVTAEVAVSHLTPFPNPAGPRRGVSPGASPGTLATIRSEFTRPVNSLRLDIFAVDGRRVRSVDGQVFRFREDASSDFSWIYEYDWDGKNESGEAVASGVYVLRLESGGTSRTSRIAIER